MTAVAILCLCALCVIAIIQVAMLLPFWGWCYIAAGICILAGIIEITTQAHRAYRRHRRQKRIPS